MSFDKLIHKVTQAENALEARERNLGADWRQLKASWRQAWTPGRIVIAGLVGGFLSGRATPLGRSGGSVLNMISALSGLFASGSAQAAAGEAEHAADTMEQATGAITPGNTKATQPLHQASTQQADTHPAQFADAADS